MHSANIIILCAIYAEAEPLIGYYNLKKSFPDFKLDTFASEDGSILLFITGTGIVRAATGVGAVCTYFSVKPSTHLINLGTCAGSQNMTGIYRINKLIDVYSGRTFYPDILVKSDMAEAPITTVARPVLDADGGDMLYDMEAAAIYEAASAWLSPHQMTFIKMVSDRGTKEAITKKAVTELIAGHLPKVTAIIENIGLCLCNQKSDEILADYVGRLSEDMHCSATMAYQLRDLVAYAVATDFDYKSFFDNYYENGSCIVKDKKAAKRVIDEFKDILIGK